MTREEAIEILNRDDTEMRKGYFCTNDFLAIETLKQEPKTDILDEIRAEIERTMETVIGHYDSTTPLHDKASYKIERNNVRKECLDIIDKYR